MEARVSTARSGRYWRKGTCLENVDDLESLARSFRDRAEELIMNDSVDREKIRKMHLFYSTEEYEEFE